MAAITGYGGSVNFGGGAVVIVKKWDIDDKANTEDTSAMASGASARKTFAVTQTEWSGTFSGQLDATESKMQGAAPAIRAGASGAATFNAGGSLAYAGTIILTSVKISNPVEGLITFDITFQGTGDLTYPS